MTRRRHPWASLLAVLLFVAWKPPSVRGQGASAWGSSAAELTRQGQKHAQNGDDALAARRFAEALRLDPSYGPAYLELALARERAGDWQEAERIYAVAIEHVPNFVAAFRARAALWRRMGQAAGEIADLETAARIGEAPDTLRDLAARYAEDRAWPAALATWRRILALAEKLADDRLAHDATVHIRALALLCGELDPVVGGFTHRDWVRRAEAAIAKRRGL